jgi:uracil phosphoribosyltransferase
MRTLALLFCIVCNMVAFGQNQAINQLVYEIRNPQTDSVHFRKALEKIGEYLALNVLEELNTSEKTIQTLTGVNATHQIVDETPVLVTILRGGLPLNYGAQKVFPHAEVGFLAMSRNEETLIATVDYIALPDLKNRTVILSDTMIGTGGSLLNAIQIVEKYGPKKIYVIAGIACEPGIARIAQYNPNIKIFAAAVDPTLNHKGYIIPGLGDAGDRCYGEKNSPVSDGQ